MSNEMYDWLRDKEVETLTMKIATKIYNYANKTFFGQDLQDIEFRKSYGCKGAENKVLDYIYINFIEPYEEEEDDSNE